jgi:dGTPase
MADVPGVRSKVGLGGSGEKYILVLTGENREALLSSAQAIEREEPDGVGARFVNRTQPSLEAQLCNLADEVAYNAHDIDDGVRSGLITLEQLQDVPLFDAYRQAVQREYPALSPRRLLYESIRRMLSDQVYDVMAHTRAAMQTVVQRSVDGVRLSPPVVGFGADMRERSLALKQFLFHNLYRHPQVMSTTDWARSVVEELFHNYLDRPQVLDVPQAQWLVGGSTVPAHGVAIARRRSP